MGQQTPTLDSGGCWVMLDRSVYPVGFCLGQCEPALSD